MIKKSSYLRWSIYFLIFSVWTIWLIDQRVSAYDRYIVNDCLADIKLQRPAVLVLGAAVYQDDKISDVFADRLDTAIDIYQAGLVKKIIISGDHGKSGYDEVSVAKNYLLEKNIPAEDIFLDHAGFDTFDSVYRAKNIFQAESLLIVTQNFHLARALYIANRINLDAWGCRADRRFYQNIEYMKNREKLAKVKAWLDINLKSKPRFLGSLINLNGDGRETWD